MITNKHLFGHCCMFSTISIVTLIVVASHIAWHRQNILYIMNSVHRCNTNSSIQDSICFHCQQRWGMKEIGWWRGALWENVWINVEFLIWTTVFGCVAAGYDSPLFSFLLREYKRIWAVECARNICALCVSHVRGGDALVIRRAFAAR